MLNTKNKNRGQVLVFFALALVALFGFAALAIDVAYWYHTRNQLQGAADAAALAGAALLTCENDTGGSSILLQTDARQSAWKFACKNQAAQQSVYLVTNNAQNCDTPPDATALNGISNVATEDIVVGHWTGTDFIAATGSTNNRINALKARPRRTEETPGMSKVTTFFGKIFGLNEVKISTTAIAQGCLTLSPISVNEYWMGNSKITGSGDCGEATFSDPERTPYGTDHVYPNSFVRPPCDPPYNGVQNCSNPTNGNVFANYTFTDFKTKDCEGDPISPAVTENGPLPANCSGPEECKGRPPGMFRAGRVFAIVGNGSFPNKGNNMHGLLNLDERIGYSIADTAGEQWYEVSGDTFTQINKAGPDSKKSVIAGYIASGNYPHTPPASVTEVFQPGYTATNLYTSNSPYASISFIDGAAAAGQAVKANFYDDGNYSGGKYAPGKKIIVAVYDGIDDGTGATQQRTTIVGYARVTIFGYGKDLNLVGVLPSVVPPSGNPNEMTMYGYIESAEDFKPTFDELEVVRTPPRLVN